MFKPLSQNLSFGNKKSDSIQKMHADELRREAYTVDKAEFVRACRQIEDVNLRQHYAVDPQSPLEFQAPRSCNTGAQNATLKIDWLEFTVAGVDPVAACRDYLKINFDRFALNDFGMHGYPDSASYGKALVLWSERKPERGTKIILSSQALDQVGRDALDILRLVISDGGTFARLDVAIDERTGFVTFETVHAAVRAAQDVTKFTQIEFREPLDARTRQPVGRSVYWGKASSSRQICCYDKALERAAKGDPVGGSWVRFEARWKKRAANLAAAVLADGGYASIPGMVRGILDFRQRDAEQAARRTACGWWDALLCSAAPIRTGIKKAVKTVEQKAAWLGAQVKKTMGQVAALMGGDTIAEICRAGAAATDERTWKQLDPTGGQRIVLGPTGLIRFAIPF